MTSLHIESDWLKRWSLYSPNKLALIDPQNSASFSYSHLFQASNRLAHHLKNKGIQAGDRIGVFSPNCVEMVALFFAAQRMGAILVPINFRLSTPEVEFILSDSSPKALIFHESLSSVVEDLQISLSKYELKDISQVLHEDQSHPLPFFDGHHHSACMILYTSGTTGFPKGAVLTNEMIYWNSMNTSLSLDLRKDDVTICFSPLFHTGGWNVLMTPFFHHGATVVLLEKFDADFILSLSEKHQATLLFGVPTTLSLMAQSPLFSSADLSSLRYMVVGGEAMPLELICLWHSKGIPIRQGFGLTEFGPNCFSLNEHEAEKKMGSIGFPNFYVQTRVVNPEGQDVSLGETGELLLSGPSCMQGYWNNPKATQDVMKQGWLHTGDLVRQDEEGYFYVVGRKKEMFISGGENVYPAEVERVLSSHPFVHEVAVIGVNDPTWGEVGQAFVVSSSHSPLIEKELKDFCQNHLAKFKIPKHFSFLSELPKGDTGKVHKRKLYEFIKNEGEHI